jgi:hypothetical protein
VRDLGAWIFQHEVGELLNTDFYKENIRLQPWIFTDLAAAARYIASKLIDGIDMIFLSEMTSFINPYRDNTFDMEDWNQFNKAPEVGAYLWIDAAFKNPTPVVIDGHPITEWWTPADTTINGIVVDSLTVNDSKGYWMFKFGYK